MACFESIGSDLPTGSRRTNVPGDVSCSETSQVSFHNLRAKTAKECRPFRARSREVAFPDKFLPVLMESPIVGFAGKGLFKRGVRAPEASRHLLAEGRVPRQLLN